MNKYKNKKVECDGIVFDSIAEMNRYCELKLLQRGGIIENLQLQPTFILQDKFTKNGVTYRAIKYKADFMYQDNGKTIVEDVKGFKTKEFLIKQKLFEAKYKNLTLKLIK